MRLWSIPLLCCAALLAACGGDDDKDGGMTERDAGRTDTGVAPDAGTRDADEPEDTGTTDANNPPPDSGTMMNDGGGTILNGRLQIGSFAFSSSTMCPATPLATDECLEVDITGCAGIANSSVVLKVTNPAGTPLGTVVLGTGGDGRGFYEGVFQPSAGPRLIAPLVQMGYRVVQRAWLPSGWSDGPGGAAKLACRPATMYAAIHDRFGAPDQAYCVSGNSGGSVEASFALAHYGLEALFDLAVPTAGPPMGRIDIGCLGATAEPGWDTQCADLHVCGPGSAQCEYTGLGVQLIDSMYASMDCMMKDASMEQTWYEDSVVNDLGDYDYPNTEVRFVYGNMDCSEAVPLGRLYYEEISSAKMIAFVSTAPHAVPADSNGADQILMDILQGCVRRH
jgi:hypothetical protein